MKHTAILLMAYGAASSLEDVPAYLQDIRGGRKPSPDLVEQVRKRYEAMGGSSPLLRITLAQAEALEKRMNGGAISKVRVYIGMRHSAPSIMDAVKAIRLDGHKGIVAMPLTPFFSKLSIGAYMKKFDEAVEGTGAPLSTLKIESWHLQPNLIAAWVEKVEKALAEFDSEERKNLRVIFTAHSLPERILQDQDPYPWQISQTIEAVAKGAGLDSFEFAYQSRGATNEPWLGPDVGKIIDELAMEGCRSLLIVPIGFVSDHMETLYDDDVLYREQASKLGMHFERAESLNDHPLLIQAMSDAIRHRLS